MLDLQEQLEQLDQRAVLDLKGHQATMDLQEQLDQLDQRAVLDLKGTLDLREQLDQRDKREVQGALDLRDRKDREVHLVYQYVVTAYVHKQQYFFGTTYF